VKARVDQLENSTMDRRAYLIGASAALIVLPRLACPSLAQRSQPSSALVTSARTQVGVTLSYDPSYTGLAFPSGDVPRARGVCTDVVIRAYRDALSLDLQALVNRDMRLAFKDYPTRWGLTRPDANIDHRRVLNLQVFLRRQGAEIPHDDPTTFLAGDLVTLTVPPALPHIGIISERKTASGLPFLIHNIGQGTREEDVLSLYPLTGRYRWFPS
jgi:uncharacterized protein